MKKVAIISLYGNYNYGNKLQNYALEKTLKKLNKEVHIIRYTCYEKDSLYKKNYLKIFNLKYMINKLKNKILTIKNKDAIAKRFNSFNEFNKKSNYSKEIIKSKKDLKSLNDKYDYFVFGSDQIWNIGAFRFYDLAFGSFFNKDKNISYSASFGLNKIPFKYKEKYIKGLSNMKQISVREESGLHLVKDLINKDAKVLLDPTMLLTKNEWTNIEKEVEDIEKDYILTYFLGGINSKQKKEIKDISKKYKLKVINLNDLKDKDAYQYGPSEFIYLIKNAKLILTDSFHSCVFSILFNKSFYVYKRNNTKEDLFDRIDTLLNKFKLQERHITSLNEVENLFKSDFKTDDILEMERNKSINYLKTNLKD